MDSINAEAEQSGFHLQAMKNIMFFKYGRNSERDFRKGYWVTVKEKRNLSRLILKAKDLVPVRQQLLAERFIL